MRLVQYVEAGGSRAVGLVSDDGATAVALAEHATVRELALSAARRGVPLARLARDCARGARVELARLAAERRLLPPLDHPDPAHCLVTGTGLSHLGSAAARDAMHAKIAKDESSLTDSMRMFKWGVEGGKPADGAVGVQPEWFYKGDGRWVANPGGDLELPPFALDGGEEVEIVALFVIGDDGEPLRLGYCLGNEFSDHVMERQNYLYLAHSKLRQSSYGPELLLGDLPAHVAGQARLLRRRETIWRDDFLSGDDNMAHAVRNLEWHHFKYRQFRVPGDVHVHFLGAATGSFTAGVKTEVGDVFEISAPAFGSPLVNTLVAAASGSDVGRPRTL
jgi:hypothetical protein